MKSAGTSRIAVTPLVFCAVKRGNDGSAVDAERRERLQIGLHTGPAARIRAGDGDGDRHAHHAPRLRQGLHRRCRVAARAAAAGSGASDSAPMTATPSAPASITAAALPASIPAMPQTGSSLLRSRRSTVDDRVQALRPDRRILLLLRQRHIDAAGTDIVDQIDRRGFGVADDLDRQADDGIRARAAAAHPRPPCRPGRDGRRRRRPRAPHRRGR